VLLMLVAGFTAMLLNPAVAKVQRRGLAVAADTLPAGRGEDPGDGHGAVVGA
jgi:hypothetical protein